MNTIDKHIKELLRVRKQVKQLELREKELKAYFDSIMTQAKANSVYGKNYYLNKNIVKKQILDTEELKADGLYDDYLTTITYNTYIGNRIN